MISIDTSAWSEFFRGRDPLVSAVDAALADNEHFHHRQGFRRDAKGGRSATTRAV
jgi:hypothetical protein